MRCLFVWSSVLKGYTIQHLPDGTVMVESIVIKVSSSAEDTNTKVLLLSWSYQVKHVGGHVFCVEHKVRAEGGWGKFGFVEFSHYAMEGKSFGAAV